MPTKTWEPPPHQHDPGRQPFADRRDEQRNFDGQPGDRGADRDADAYERQDLDSEDINTHGSER